MSDFLTIQVLVHSSDLLATASSNHAWIRPTAHPETASKNAAVNRTSLDKLESWTGGRITQLRPDVEEASPQMLKYVNRQDSCRHCGNNGSYRLHYVSRGSFAKD